MNSKSPHNSLAFMVRNHTEEKRRGKTRFHDNTNFYGYYNPNKTVLLL